MAIIGTSVPTLLDITTRLDPDGKLADIAELLTKDNPVLEDMVWKEGNLPTGERITVRTGLPSVAYRALNEGVPRSKSNTAQVDEGAAMLEAFSEVDRKIAILSSNVAEFRLSEASAFLEAMNQRMAQTLFYGNAGASPKEFNGFSIRYNSLSGVTGANIIDAGGTGTTNRSIWLIGWATDKISGIYPKGTKAGLFHEDMSDVTMSTDGFPRGTILYDASGNPYVGYRDHYEWNTGLSIRDWRYAVRIANIDNLALSANMSTGANIQLRMTAALDLIQSLNGVKPVFYMPRKVQALLRQQLLTTKNTFLSWDEMAGQRVMMFGEVPVKRVDALNVDEARVV